MPALQRTRLPVRGLTILFALTVAGCSDLASILRDELAMESEMVDRITFVVDEASAKDYTKAFDKASKDNLERISKLKAELVEGLEKGSKEVWRKYEDMLKKALNVNYGDAISDVYARGSSDAPTKLMAELKDVFEKPVRDKGQEPKPGSWEKNLEGIPSGNVLNRYIREKLALRVAREHEAIRLQQHVDEVGNAPSMTPVIAALKSFK